MGEIVRLPPVAQAALRIEERALVIEAVADFVADHRANGAVVHGEGLVGIEIRWLQYGGGKVDGIHRGQVHGIDELGVHDPFATVDR